MEPRDFFAKYDRADAHTPRYIAPSGLSEALVRSLSERKGEPAWMLQKRLLGLATFQSSPLPTWGPDLSGISFGELSYVVEPNAGEARTWEGVPEDIRSTFTALGIPQAEQAGLAGVGAQYDGATVYHHLREDLAAQGVRFYHMDEAVREVPELVEEYFMTRCVPVFDHPFAALHAAVWSGGTFIEVPEGVTVEIPLQAYFRMNAPGSGQFEHTLIIARAGSKVHYIEGCSAPKYDRVSLHAGCVEIFVEDNAQVRYSSFESWSKNTYNLNTKRAIVEDGGIIEWLNGNIGSAVTMLYPMSVLKGRGARSVYRGVALAGPGQTQDTGHKVALVAPDTRAEATSKSVSFGGGQAVYRGLIKATPGAVGAEVHVTCDSLVLDAHSGAQATPVLEVSGEDVAVAHEAHVGRLDPLLQQYLHARGMTSSHATQLLVTGYLQEITDELPLEYAVEFLALVEHQLSQSV